jgi:hypothetical protein
MQIGLEAGPLSQWLYAGLTQGGFETTLLETRHVNAALSAMTVKTDRQDARGIAQLLRVGWFRPVHAKSIGSQEIRALLVARKQLLGKLRDVELSIRGILRGCQLARRLPNLFVDKTPVLVVWTDHALPWFECLRCARRCRHIFLPEIACRKCLRLDYASRHLHRQTSSVHQVARLRKKLGADPRPFAPLPERPRSYTRFHRIAAEIRALEFGLVGQLGEINRVLERRARKLK